MNRLLLRGTDLRYVLTLRLHQHGTASVAELLDDLTAQGFTVAGRPSKTVSDALRWEQQHGRVYRRGRGRYGPAYLPRSTEYRILHRVLALREQGRAALREQGRAALSLGGGQSRCRPGQ